MAIDIEKDKAQQSDFEEYRNRMHPEQGASRSSIPAPHKAVRMAFGVFMILLYLGMGVALMCNVFNWDESFTWMRWLIGVVLVIYGIFRGYRQFAGTDYYGN